MRPDHNHLLQADLCNVRVHSPQLLSTGVWPVFPKATSTLPQKHPIRGREGAIVDLLGESDEYLGAWVSWRKYRFDKKMQRSLFSRAYRCFLSFQYSTLPLSTKPLLPLTRDRNTRRGVEVVIEICPVARNRTSHSPQIKAKVALEGRPQAVQDQRIGAQVIPPSQLDSRMEEAVGGASGRDFPTPRSKTGKEDETALIPELYQQTGRLKVELEWLKKIMNLSVTERRAIIEVGPEWVSVARQCALPGLSRSSYYCRRSAAEPVRSRAHARSGSPLHPQSFSKACVASCRRCARRATRSITNAHTGSCRSWADSLAPNLPLSALPAGGRPARHRMGQ